MKGTPLQLAPPAAQPHPDPNPDPERPTRAHLRSSCAQTAYSPHVEEPCLSLQNSMAQDTAKVAHLSSSWAQTVLPSSKNGESFIGMRSFSAQTMRQTPTSAPPGLGRRSRRCAGWCEQPQRPARGLCPPYPQLLPAPALCPAAPHPPVSVPQPPSLMPGILASAWAPIQLLLCVLLHDRPPISRLQRPGL